MNTSPDNDHWLVRPRTIRWLWVLFSAVLAVTVLLQFKIKVKGYFGIDTWFGFGAVFGLLVCVGMVVIAKALGYFLKRDENFYDD